MPWRVRCWIGSRSVVLLGGNIESSGTLLKIAPQNEVKYRTEPGIVAAMDLGNPVGSRPSYPLRLRLDRSVRVWLSPIEVICWADVVQGMDVLASRWLMPRAQNAELFVRDLDSDLAAEAAVIRTVPAERTLAVMLEMRRRAALP